MFTFTLVKLTNEYLSQHMLRRADEALEGFMHQFLLKAGFVQKHFLHDHMSLLSLIYNDVIKCTVYTINITLY